MIRFVLFFIPLSLFSKQQCDVPLLEGLDFGVFPTNVDLCMTPESYAFSMAFLGMFSAFLFWLGFNSRT